MHFTTDTEVKSLHSALGSLCLAHFYSSVLASYPTSYILLRVVDKITCIKNLDLENCQGSDQLIMGFMVS